MVNPPPKAAPPGITREYRERAALRIDSGASTVEEEAKAAKVSPRAVRAWRLRARKRAKDAPPAPPRPAPPRDDARLRAALDAAGEHAAPPVAAPRIAPPPGAAPPPQLVPGVSDADVVTHLATQCATPEGVVGTVEDVMGSVVMLYASTTGVPESPQLHDLARFTEAERLKLLCWAPYAVPYVQTVVGRVPQIGVALFGLALFTMAVGRVRAVRELAPKRLRRAAADPAGRAATDHVHSASPNSATPISGTPHQDDDEHEPAEVDDAALEELQVEGWPRPPFAQAGTQQAAGGTLGA